MRVMRTMRKHNYNDYQAEEVICHDKVRICNKNDPYEVYTGYMGSCDNRRFMFEYDNISDYSDITQEKLWYADWIIEYLK